MIGWPPVMPDVIIVGGGLAGGLAAWRLAAVRPELDVRVLEHGATLGGNHTWSFHDADVPASALTWLAPLVTSRWPSYAVHFPRLSRVVDGGYNSVAASHFHDVVSAYARVTRDLRRRRHRAHERRVTLASGAVIEARVVIDARGAAPVRLPLGWQVFVGEEFECADDHGLTVPILMDATVPQVDAYRFIYVLPLDARRLLVEDTSYADDPTIDVARSRAAIARYNAARGWRVARVLREESGALPLPLGGQAEVFWPDDAPRIGMRAGVFHPTTGYSLPDAAATADLLAAIDLRDADATGRTLRDFAVSRWRARSFFRLLNRLLFRAARPGERAHVLEQFHRRPADLISRFYSATLTRTDRCRLLAGRPPVSLLRAARHVSESSVM